MTCKRVLQSDQSKRHLTLLLRRKLRRLTETDRINRIQKINPVDRVHVQTAFLPLVWSVCFVDAALQRFNASTFNAQLFI